MHWQTTPRRLPLRGPPRLSPPGETPDRRTRIVLEGVTGAGKSSVIGALRESGRLPACFVSEDETFGDAMLEVGQPGFRRRLTEVCARFASGPTGQGLPDEILIERFHLSYYAQEPVRSRPPVNSLGAASRETAGSLPDEPDWTPYRVFDDWLLDGDFRRTAARTFVAATGIWGDRLARVCPPLRK